MTRLAWAAQMVRDAPRQARFGFSPAAGITRAQEQRVGAAVAYARVHVPYYRETMRKLILGAEELRTADDLARLPMIEREQVQRDPEYFLSEDWPRRSLIELRSGGSTGAPLSIFRDPRSLFAEAAQYERLRSVIARLAGRRLRFREAMVVPVDSSTGRTASAFRRANPLPRNLRVDLHTVTLRPPERVIAELNEIRPDVLGAYGSYLEELFTYVRQHRPQFVPPRVAVYGADSLAPSAREWARGELGIEILSNYGAVEAPHIGFECEQHRGYHLNVDLHPIRLLGPDGATGEVVVSNLVNQGTVLLNYRLGDILTLRREPCPCGRQLPLCAYLERTKQAWLTMGDGRKIHAQNMRLILHRDRDVRRYQLVQESERQLLARIVPADGSAGEAMAARIGSGLRQALPEDVDVRVEFVEQLSRDASGKVQPIVPLRT